MLDRFGREIDYLRLSVTEQCGLRCRYCMPDGAASCAPPPSLDRLVELGTAAAACGIRKIRLTGGEPLTRPDLPELCRRLRNIPGLTELCLTTNGIQLARYASSLRDAGLDRLNISLDSLRSDRYAHITGGGRLSDVWDGIRAAETAGFHLLKLNTVLMGGVNDDEIPDFAALTQSHPWEVRFIEIMPMGPCAVWPPERFLSCDAVLTSLSTLQPIPSNGTARRYQLPGACGTIGLITSLSHNFCSQCSRIRITADGCLKPCLHSAVELPLTNLHGRALVEAIQEGIRQKPAQHLLHTSGSQTDRTMNRIGG